MILFFGLKPKMGAGCVHRFLNGKVWKMRQKRGYTGIHWPSLDEDLGYEGLFVDARLCEATPEECSVVCET